MSFPRLLRRVAVALAATLAACVPSAPPPAPPPPSPVPPPLTPPAPPAADWQDRPRTAGTWRYERDARGSRALFGALGADALVVLRCEAGERRLFLSRAGSSTAPFVIRTTALTRSVAARATGATPPYAAAAFAPADPLLDAMAFSRGRIALEQAGTTPLTLPPWAEIGRVVEDCRG